MGSRQVDPESSWTNADLSEWQSRGVVLGLCLGAIVSEPMWLDFGRTMLPDGLGLFAWALLPVLPPLWLTVQHHQASPQPAEEAQQ